MRGNISNHTELTKLSLLQLQALIFLAEHNHAQMREIAEHFKIELITLGGISALFVKENKRDFAGKIEAEPIEI